MKPMSRKNDLVIQQLDGERLVYDLKANKAFCLNNTSSIVWDLCNGRRSAREIRDVISAKFKTNIDENFVSLALIQLEKDGLLETSGDSYFEGLSRREVIRKIGFVSVVALPMITSVVAPEAIFAQSACAPGAAMGGTASTCTSDNDCSECNCLQRNPVDGTRHCCVASATGVGAGAAVNPGGFLDCVPNDGVGMATCAEDAPICCNGTSTFTGLQGACPFATQSECRCVP